MKMRNAIPEEIKGVHDYIEGISEKVIPLTEEAYSDLCLRAARYEELKQAVQEIREEIANIKEFDRRLINIPSKKDKVVVATRDLALQIIDRKMASYSDIPNK